MIVELDGFEGHGTRRAFEDDRVRDATLQLAGYRVIRITWRRLKHTRMRLRGHCRNSSVALFRKPKRFPQA